MEYLSYERNRTGTTLTTAAGAVNQQAALRTTLSEVERSWPGRRLPGGLPGGNIAAPDCVLICVYLRPLVFAALMTLLTGVATAAQPQLLVVLEPTGQTREGLPVLTRHRAAERVVAVLSRGFSGRLLRLYALEQAFLSGATGRAPEPAYLLLSDRQGGFPQFGFYLDGVKKADAGWVDLHRRSTLSGRFGAMDQIFPHELLHVIVRQLAGEPRESGGNQMHAIGVRTDPVNAFSEGFAEHVQVLSVDDPDAVPETAALREDGGARARAEREFAGYGRELAARFPLARPSQMRFLLWFSQGEQVLRYHAVKANQFARAVAIPDRLLDRPDKYDAYLYQSVVLGAPSGPRKPASVMLSSEGVVAYLFWRFASDPALQHRFLDERTCAAFGVTTADLSPLENVYLKLFVALFEGRPATAAELLRAYVRRFPEDAPDVERVARGALLGQDLPDATEIWLANAALMTGTSLFDQFRALPRQHTFDANAATELDWLAVPGVTRDLAARLLAHAPYARIDDVLAVPGLKPDVKNRVVAMAKDMDALRARAASEEESLSLAAILRPYLWRLITLLTLTTAAGAWLARRAGARRWWSATAVALVSSLAVIALAWAVTSPPWYPAVAPVVLFGAPWGLWRLLRQRAPRAAAVALAVWAAASIPAVLISRAWW
jgi:hypothetical protein